MRTFIGIVALVASAVSLGSCDNARAMSREAAFCKSVLEQNLKSPSSLKVIDVVEHHDADKPRIEIVYDATNSYGGVIRDKATCLFYEALPTPEGKVAQLKGFWTNNYEMPDYKLALINVDAVQASLKEK